MHRLLPCLCLLLGAASCAAAQSGTERFYRWIDDQGRLHLSDKPPPAGADRAEEMRVPRYAEPEQPADQDPYSILNQLKRLEASRREMLRQRWEREQRDREYDLRRRELEARERAAAAPPAGTAIYAFPRRLPPHPRFHHPGRPSHQPQRAKPRSLWEPDHPVYRPPRQPPHQPPRHPAPQRSGRVDPGG